MKHKVLIPQEIAYQGNQYLFDRGYEINEGSGVSVQSLEKEVRDCAAILARTALIPSEVLSAGKKMPVVSRHGVEVDSIDVEGTTQLGIYVTNTPEALSDTVSEHAIALILILAKNIMKFHHETKKGNFEIRNSIRGVDLKQKTLGIVGIGRIGSAVAEKKIKGLGMKAIAYDPYLTSGKAPKGVTMVSELELLFKSGRLH